MITKKAKSLESALAIIEKMEWVAGATIWTPTAEEVDEYKADGLEARPQLEVTVYKSHRNADRHQERHRRDRLGVRERRVGL
jgi:putative NIF3 family GTP cyclohydrolase 1 type 2